MMSGQIENLGFVEPAINDIDQTTVILVTSCNFFVICSASAFLTSAIINSCYNRLHFPRSVLFIIFAAPRSDNKNPQSLTLVGPLPSFSSQIL